ncbi:MAG: hypothetical protein R3F42_14795 [Pseudomonadota bacterium]
MISKRTFVLLALLAGLCGCAELQPYRAAVLAPVVDGRSGANIWLEALHGVRDKSPEQQQQILEDWERSFAAKPNIDNRMRLVLLMTLGGESVRDIRRARRLLDEVDPLPEAAADREMVVVLQQMLDEQGQSARKLSILWKQVTEQNRRIEELEQQLQALTTIEQNIQSRDAPAVIENEQQ